VPHSRARRTVGSELGQLGCCGDVENQAAIRNDLPLDDLKLVGTALHFPLRRRSSPSLGVSTDLKQVHYGSECCPLGTFFPGGEVAGLLVGELVYIYAHSLELEAGDLAVYLLGQWIYLVLELPLVVE
jgi:hypothetical protein